MHYGVDVYAIYCSPLRAFRETGCQTSLPTECVSPFRFSYLHCQRFRVYGYAGMIVSNTVLSENILSSMPN